ncbi:hypothetical protein AHAS_Ahas05G0097800 [Arachis hypogaea]
MRKNTRSFVLPVETVTLPTEVSSDYNTVVNVVPVGQRGMPTVDYYVWHTLASKGLSKQLTRLIDLSLLRTPQFLFLLIETGILFYEVDQPYIYEDPVFHSCYTLTTEPRMRLYVLCDHPFQHLLVSPSFDPDAPYEFSLSWLYPDAPGYPFPDGPGHPHPAQPVNQATPKPADFAEPILVNDYIPAISLEWDFSPEPIVPDAQLDNQLGLPKKVVAPIYVNGYVLTISRVSSDNSATTGNIMVIPDDDEEENPEMDFEQELPSSSSVSQWVSPMITCPMVTL